jgi:hypothetical protein
LFSGCVVVGVTVTVASSVRVTSVVGRFGLLERPIEVRYQSASLRTSVPHQSTVPPSIVLCRQPEVDVRSAAASLYFFSLFVHFGSVSGSRALLVGRLRTAIELLTPASASENAEVRERAWVDCWALEVE